MVIVVSRDCLIRWICTWPTGRWNNTRPRPTPTQVHGPFQKDQVSFLRQSCSTSHRDPPRPIALQHYLSNLTISLTHLRLRLEGTAHFGAPHRASQPLLLSCHPHSQRPPLAYLWVAHALQGQHEQAAIRVRRGDVVCSQIFSKVSSILMVHSKLSSELTFEIFYLAAFQSATVACLPLLAACRL